MGSSSTSGTSVSNCMINSPGSEDDQQLQMVDQRKRKRMLSNRESARRSRMRKQKHLDELVSQVGELKKDNAQILTSINITSQLYARVESENSVLRAQMAELANRLQSLNDIINCINASTNNNVCMFEGNNVFEDIVGVNNHVNHQILSPDRFEYHGDNMVNGLMSMNNPWNSIPMNQPIMDQIYTY